MRHVRSRSRRRRRGLALIPALVCLVLTGLLGLVLLRQAGLRRSVLRQDLRRTQAGWLAESGLARAAARLAAEPGYRGETWTTAVPTGGDDVPAAVTITIEPAAGPDRRRTVRSVAEYPAAGEPALRVHQTRQLTLEPGPGPEPTPP